MEPKFQSSFIPKGPLASSGAAAASSTKKKSIFSAIATAVFGIALAASAGVYAYNYYLEYRITKMGEEIEAARGTLQPEVIEEITRLDSRLTSTANLIASHMVISPFFEYLEGSTVQAVRFTEFFFETVEEGLRVRMEGEARGYIAVALQSELFNESGHFTEPVFSDLRLDDEGDVTFTFTGLVDPELLSYERLVEGNLPPASAPLQEAPVATTTPAVQEPAPSSATTTAPSSSTTPATVI